MRKLIPARPSVYGYMKRRWTGENFSQYIDSMAKAVKRNKIVSLSREEYDQLVAIEDSRDAETARRIIEQIASGAETVLSESQLDEFLRAEAPPAADRSDEAISRLARELAKKHAREDHEAEIEARQANRPAIPESP